MNIYFFLWRIWYNYNNNNNDSNNCIYNSHHYYNFVTWKKKIHDEYKYFSIFINFSLNPSVDMEDEISWWLLIMVLFEKWLGNIINDLFFFLRRGGTMSLCECYGYLSNSAVMYNITRGHVYIYTGCTGCPINLLLCALWRGRDTLAPRASTYERNLTPRHIPLIYFFSPHLFLQVYMYILFLSLVFQTTSTSSCMPSNGTQHNSGIPHNELVCGSGTRTHGLT